MRRVLMEDFDILEFSIDDLISAIFRDQIQHGGEIADYWTELNEQLIVKLGGNPDDGFDDYGLQMVYNISYEKWFAIGFKAALQVKNLMR